MKEKQGTEPAFPKQETLRNDFSSEVLESGSIGISKRLYIATKAMQGLVVGDKNFDIMYKDGFLEPKEIIKTAFKLADELLRQENE